MDGAQQGFQHSMTSWITVIGFPVALIGLLLWKPFYEPSLTIRASSSSAEPSTGVPASFTVEKAGILNANSLFFRCYYAKVQTLGQFQLSVVDMATGSVAELVEKVKRRQDPAS
jgi:hypothetical protein